MPTPPEFIPALPFSVRNPAGQVVAAFAQPGHAIYLCETLGTGASICIGSKLAWLYHSESWQREMSKSDAFVTFSKLASNLWEQQQRVVTQIESEKL